MTVTRTASGPAVHTVVAADGTRLRYRSTGHGTAVVVIPGALTLAKEFDALASALGADFTVHTLERRGHGESGPQGAGYGIGTECADVAALRAEVGADLLVGHSYGGLVALEAARRDPAVRRIAVYEPGVSVDGLIPTGWMAGVRRPAVAGAEPGRVRVLRPRQRAGRRSGGCRCG